MADKDKRIFGELSDEEVKQRAKTCNVGLGDAQRFQAGIQSLSPSDSACLKAGMADDPANFRTGAFSRLTGAAKDAFDTARKEFTGAAVGALEVGVNAVRDVGGPVVTHGLRKAESVQNYDKPPAGPGR